MPVNNVWNGMGESMLPIIDVRSAGTVDRSKPTAASANITTKNAIASTPIPEYVSITATARKPPVIVYMAAIIAIGAANQMSDQSTPNIDFKNRLPE